MIRGVTQPCSILFLYPPSKLRRMPTGTLSIQPIKLNQLPHNLNNLPSRHLTPGDPAPATVPSVHGPRHDVV